MMYQEPQKIEVQGLTQIHSEGEVLVNLTSAEAVELLGHLIADCPEGKPHIENAILKLANALKISERPS